MEEEKGECIICLEPWASLDPQRVRLLPCGHELWYALSSKL
jgi:hypothetical protein